MQTERQSDQRQIIGVLFGFRALMVLFVCNFHIWQQGWLRQFVVVFGHTVDFDYWTRASYVFVDGMMLLSAFLLYLPFARQAVYATPVPGVRAFYLGRFARIVPSYLLSVLVMLFCVALPQGAYRDAAAQNLDILTHLTFTFTFFRETYLFTPLNVVLWTVVIEMQFYLIFPWLARAVRKSPTVTLCLMIGAGILFRAVLGRQVADLSLLINQLPAFLDVYALGMLGAILYVRLNRRVEGLPRGAPLVRVLRVGSPLLFTLGCLALSMLLRVQTNQGLISYEHLRLSQWLVRLPLALTLLGMMLAAMFLPRWLQKPLDNRFMRFLATISFNLYIWHQALSVQLARHLFPVTLHDDFALQKAFTLLCYTLSIVVAMAVTFGVEQPAVRLLTRIFRTKSGSKETIRHEGSPDANALSATDPLLVRDAQGGAGAS